MTKLGLLAVLVALDVLIKEKNLNGAGQVVTRLLEEVNSKTAKQNGKDEDED